MTYTLLGMPTLGFDLVRSDQGAQTAALLRLALRVESGDLVKLAAEHPGRVRRARWRELVAAQHTAGQAITDLRGTGTLNSDVLLRQLESSRLGSVEALDRLVRRELLSWTWRDGADSDLVSQTYLGSLAADVLVDAVAASYCGTGIDTSLRQQLTEPLHLSGVNVDPREPAADLPDATRAVLNLVAALDADGRQRLRDAVRREGSPRNWAAAMHEATWAAHLSGRHRSAAVAQLLAVEAFLGCGFTARDGAYGVWNCVAGVVHASLVQDLLGMHYQRSLLGCWRAAGLPPLR